MAKHLDFFTSVPQRRIQEIILSSYTSGDNGKLTDYAEVFPVHQTTYGHFLSKSKCNKEKVAKIQEYESFQTTLKLDITGKAPVFVSVDDTVIPKTKPLSKAKRPTEGTCSGLEEKLVYGYQVNATIVSTGETSLCYFLKRYAKEQATKVEMAKAIVQQRHQNDPPNIFLKSRVIVWLLAAFFFFDNIPYKSTPFDKFGSYARPFSARGPPSGNLKNQPIFRIPEVTICRNLCFLDFY